MAEPARSSRALIVSSQKAEEEIVAMGLQEFEAALDNGDFEGRLEEISARLCMEQDALESQYQKAKKGYLPDGSRGKHLKTLAADLEKRKTSYEYWRNTMLANRVRKFEEELAEAGITEGMDGFTEDLTRALERIHKNPGHTYVAGAGGGKKLKADAMFDGLRKKLATVVGEDSQKLRSIFHKIDGFALTFAEATRIHTSSKNVLLAADALNARTIALNQMRDRIQGLTDKIEMLNDKKALAAKRSLFGGTKTPKSLSESFQAENVQSLKKWLFPMAADFRHELSLRITPLYEFLAAANDARPKLSRTVSAFDRNENERPAILLARDLTALMAVAAGQQSREPEVRSTMRIVDLQAQNPEEDVLSSGVVEKDHPFLHYVARRYNEDVDMHPDDQLLSRAFRVARHVDDQFGVQGPYSPTPTVSWSGSVTPQIGYEGPQSGGYNVTVNLSPGKG